MYGQVSGGAIGRGGVGVSAGVGNIALARTGAYALLWAELGVVLLIVGFVLLRIAQQRRRRAGVA